MLNIFSRLFTTRLRRITAFIWVALMFLLFFYHQSNLLKLSLALWSFYILFILVILLFPFLLLIISSRKKQAAAKMFLIISSLCFAALICGWPGAPTLERLRYFGIAVFVLIAASILGRTLLEIFKLKLPLQAERILLSVVLGLGSVSLLTLIVGAVIGVSFYLYGAMLLIVFGVCHKSFVLLYADFKLLLKSWQQHMGFTELILASAILLSILITLPYSFVPPMDYDVTEYHAQLPREYLKQGSISFRPDNLFSGMPQNMEMLTTLSFALNRSMNGWPTAKLLNWLFLPLLAAIGILIIKSLADNRSGLLAGMLLLSTPLSSYLASKLYVELGLVVYGLAAFLLIVKARDNPAAGRFLFTAGILAGFAAGCKYPGLIFICLPLAFFVLLMSGSRENKISLTAWFLSGLLLAFSPWLVKNFLETGNPVFPLWNSFFGVNGWSEVLAKRFYLAHRPSDFSLTALYHNTVNVLFAAKELIPVGFLFFSLLLLPTSDRQKSSRWTDLVLCFWVLLILILWFLLTHRLERFLYPCFVITALGSALGWGRVKNHFIKYFLLLMLIGVFVLVEVLVLWGLYLSRPKEIFQIAFADKPYSATLKTDPTYNTGLALGTLKPESKILALGEAAFFWLPDNVEGSIVFSQHPLEKFLEESETGEQFAFKIKKAGYTHILINWSELLRLHATYYKAYSFTKAEQKILRNGFARLVVNSKAVYSMWPKWPTEGLELPEVALQDLKKYSRQFHTSRKLKPKSTYLRARPWLAAVALGPPERIKPTASAKRLADLWQEWQVLLAPFPAGGPPPLGFSPMELLELRKN